MAATVAALAVTVDGMETEFPLSGRALVVLVDDQVESDDRRGPLIAELLAEDGFLVDAFVSVPSDVHEIRKALETAVIGGVDLVVTVGGTGVGPRDVTPEATEQVLDQRIPGIAEALRSSGLAAGSVDACVSRGVVGVSGSTLVVNIASERAAIRDGMATLGPLVRRVIGQLSSIED